MADQKNSGFSAEKFLSSYPDASSPTSVAPKKAKESPAKTVPDPPPKKEKSDSSEKAGTDFIRFNGF